MHAVTCPDCERQIPVPPDCRGAVQCGCGTLVSAPRAQRSRWKPDKLSLLLAGAFAFMCLSALWAVVYLTKSPNPAPPPDPPAAFSSTDVTETRRWLREKIWEFERTRAGKNDIATQDAFGAVRKELSPHVGQAVAWRLTIDRVEEGWVYLEDYRVFTAGGCTTWFVISDSSPGRSSIRADVMGRSQVAKLRKGGEVLLKGKIDRFSFDGSANELFCSAILKDISIEP